MASDHQYSQPNTGSYTPGGGSSPWWRALAETAVKQGPGWVILAFMVWWLTHSVSGGMSTLADKFDAHAGDMKDLYREIQATDQDEHNDRQTLIRLVNVQCRNNARTEDQRGLCDAVVQTTSGSGS